MRRWKDPAWRYWLVTDLLLLAWLSGVAPALWGLIALCGVQLAHYRLREGRWAAFAVQVRLAYLGLILAGAWGPLRVLHWLQLAGTTAMVAADYCPLARLLSLMPWNRQGPLSLGLVWRRFASAPVGGSILEQAPPRS